MMNRDIEIAWAMMHLSDLVPHDDPNYYDKLRQMSEDVVDNDAKEIENNAPK